MNYAPLLEKKPLELRKQFIDDYASLFPIDRKKAIHYIETNERFDYLTEKWYECLSKNDLENAYSVYNDEYYFTDLWNCFVRYSRTYLRRFYKVSIDDTHSVLSMTKQSKKIIDIGCGIGYTTAALTEMYPDAEVYGLNLKNTKQWTFCEKVSEKYGFNMIDSFDNTYGNFDIAFASEFFEHILDPIDYVHNLIFKINPKYLIISNAFNTHSIGHFNEYNVACEGRVIHAADISKKFNKTLTNYGYRKIKTTLFNGKPNVWVKGNIND